MKDKGMKGMGKGVTGAGFVKGKKTGKSFVDTPMNMGGKGMMKKGK